MQYFFNQTLRVTIIVIKRDKFFPQKRINYLRLKQKPIINSRELNMLRSYSIGPLGQQGDIDKEHVVVEDELPEEDKER